MKAFLNDEKVKDKYLSRVKAHALADEIIKGKYWQNGKGCAVGCTIHSSNHSAYETELGIPEWLARVEDTIFEWLPNEKSKKWPELFLASINVGGDLEKIKTPFIIFILESCIESMDAAKYDADKFPNVKAAIEQSKRAVIEMIKCHREGLDPAAWSAESVAWSAAAWAWASARSVAAASARSVAAAVAWSARSAAWSAAWSAESVAWSARSVAWASSESVAWSAAESAAESAESAESVAWSAESAESAYEKYADKLIELIKGCV